MRFIFDLDGTICFKGQPISKSILDCLLELEQEGHTVGFASARPCRDML
ncbi:HAD hydrolase family protein, partial [Brevibacillus parabrevis]